MSEERVPLVSIWCLVYNHEPYLRQCLDGFVMQRTSFPFEAIVHEDASTDGSAAIIREYAEKYPDIIKPIYETENQYFVPGSLRRIMVESIHPGSKYIAVCEGDDYWTDPNKLQMQVDALESHPECTIAFCKVGTISKDNEPLGGTYPSENSQIPVGVLTLDDFMKEEYYYSRWTFHTSSFFYRKSCLPLHYQLRTTLYKNFPYGDQPLILSCLFQGNGYYIPTVTGVYRMLSGGFLSSLRENPQKEIRVCELLTKSLRELDSYTSGKYKKYIDKRIKGLNYWILKLKFENGLSSQLEKLKYISLRIEYDVKAKISKYLS